MILRDSLLLFLLFGVDMEVLSGVFERETLIGDCLDDVDEARGEERNGREFDGWWKRTSRFLDDDEGFSGVLMSADG